jgi:hypothetical protein
LEGDQRKKQQEVLPGEAEPFRIIISRGAQEVQATDFELSRQLFSSWLINIRVQIPSFRTNAHSAMNIVDI